jgi:hypothetical protein
MGLSGWHAKGGLFCARKNPLLFSRLHAKHDHVTYLRKSQKWDGFLLIQTNALHLLNFSICAAR